MSDTMKTPQYPDLTAPGIEMWMEEEAKQYKPMYTKIFSLESTSRLYEDDSSISGIGYPEEIVEGGASPSDSFLVGYLWRYEPSIYAKKVSVTKLMEITDLYGTDISKAEGRSRELSKKAAQWRDVKAFSVFRRAWDDDVSYGDGKNLISVGHPRKDGGADQANTFTADTGKQLPLTYDNLKKLEDILIEVVANNGMPIDVGLDANLLLMVTPYNRETALQIAETDAGTPGVADHSVNYWKGRNVDVMVVPYLSHRFAKITGETSSTDREAYDKRYFLLDPSYTKKLMKFKQLKDFDVRAWEDPDTRNWYANVYDIFSVGISGWFGCAGSRADDNTYTG